MPRPEGRPIATFSATVRVSTSMKCWWIIPMPRAMASVGLRDVDRFAVESDLALVGPVEAVEDLHQRALAGTVLAQQGVHLTGAHLEVDTVAGHHAWEPLDDAAHREHRGLGHVVVLLYWVGRGTRSVPRPITCSLRRRDDRTVDDACDGRIGLRPHIGRQIESRR